MDHPPRYRTLLPAIVILLALTALPLVFRAFRSAPPAPPKLEAAVAEFQRPVDNSLDDVSDLATDFEAVVSLTPLREQSGQIEKLVYNTDIETLNRFVDADGKVIAPKKGARRLPTQAGSTQHTQQFVKEILFQPSEDADTIAHVERIYTPEGEVPPELSDMRAERILHVDGRYLEPPANEFKENFREIDPLWNSASVAAGSAWTQRIAVDPELNPGGEVLANVRVISTFIRDDQRYVRVRRDYKFKAYRPQSARGAGAQLDEQTRADDAGKNQVLQYRVDELFDLNLDTGIVTQKSTVTQFLVEGLKLAGLEDTVSGLLVTIRAREELASVVHRNHL